MALTTTPEVTMRVTRVDYQNGVCEFHAADCKSRKGGGWTSSDHDPTPAEILAFKADVDAEARELGVPKSEQQTRFHPCVVKAAKAAAAA